METLKAIILVDRQGTINYWNEGAASIFGHQSTSALGQSMELIIPPRFRARHWAAFDKAMDTTPSERIDVGATALMGWHSSQKEIELEVRLMRVPDSRDNPVGAVAVFQKRNYDDPLTELY